MEGREASLGQRQHNSVIAALNTGSRVAGVSFLIMAEVGELGAGSCSYKSSLELVSPAFAISLLSHLIPGNKSLSS